ncbi:MAG: hypothetical protein V1702_05660 [Candidatus Woesearchaeota archaeon]
MKTAILSFLLFSLTVFFVGCTSEIQENGSTTLEKPQLSELQSEACNSADSAGTCSTRLAELGIVLKEHCCAGLGKCC